MIGNNNITMSSRSHSRSSRHQRSTSAIVISYQQDKPGQNRGRTTQAQIKALLKKPGLDDTVFSNYRPISNLNTISKILERLFLVRIQSHVLLAVHRWFSVNFLALNPDKTEELDSSNNGSLVFSIRLTSPELKLQFRRV